MKRDAIIIKKQDNVGTALKDIQLNENIITAEPDDKVKKVTMKENVPYGHKFAVKNIKKGDPIIKYGEIIGRATQDIAKGSHAHIHNIESLRGRGDLEK